MGPKFEQQVRRALLASPSTWWTTTSLAAHLKAPTREIRTALQYLEDTGKVVSQYTPALTRSWVQWRWANPVTARRVQPAAAEREQPPAPEISRARLIDRAAS